jgi:hypothetical protein
VEKHVKMAVLTHHTDWDERLPLFLLAYKSPTLEATGMMPVRMKFRKEQVCPATTMTSRHFFS